MPGTAVTASTSGRVFLGNGRWELSLIVTTTHDISHESGVVIRVHP